MEARPGLADRDLHAQGRNPRGQEECGVAGGEGKEGNGDEADEVLLLAQGLEAPFEPDVTQGKDLLFPAQLLNGRTGHRKLHEGHSKVDLHPIGDGESGPSVEREYAVDRPIAALEVRRDLLKGAEPELEYAIHAKLLGREEVPIVDEDEVAVGAGGHEALDVQRGRGLALGPCRQAQSEEEGRSEANRNRSPQAAQSTHAATSDPHTGAPLRTIAPELGTPCSRSGLASYTNWCKESFHVCTSACVSSSSTSSPIGCCCAFLCRKYRHAPPAGAPPPL